MIKFINHDRKFNFSQKKLLGRFIEMLFREEGKVAGDIRYIFCSDDYLLQINKDFLRHDYYTDIITFDLSTAGAVDAEIYISTDRVKENAAEYNERLNREMLRVVFHGALHLCGYRDKTKSEITLMRERENKYLRLFDIENPQSK